MDRDMCKFNERIALRAAWHAPDEETRETYYRIAQTWRHQAEGFIDPNVEAVDHST